MSTEITLGLIAGVWVYYIIGCVFTRQKQSPDFAAGATINLGLAYLLHYII